MVVACLYTLRVSQVGTPQPSATFSYVVSEFQLRQPIQPRIQYTPIHT